MYHVCCAILKAHYNEFQIKRNISELLYGFSSTFHYYILLFLIHNHHHQFICICSIVCGFRKRKKTKTNKQ